MLTILALKRAEEMRHEDLVVILNVAMTKEVARYGDMLMSPHSFIDNFIKNPKSEEVEAEEEKAFRRVVHEFQNKVRKAMMYSVLFQKKS